MITYRIDDEGITIRIPCPITHFITIWHYYAAEDNKIQKLSHSLNPLETVEDKYPLLNTNNVVGKHLDEVEGIINTYNLLKY